ncbi:MAG: fructose-bisphosphate aldolase, partial [Actinomycetota bacterium]|nr:fructose-bisphosphate aldolase [Actinomycetota bacterium]
MLRTTARVRLDDLDVNLGKRVRLHRLLYEHGPANGTLLLLPIDQGLEHGPVDFFDNPDSLDPEFQFRLAVEGGFSGIALHFGLAQKYLRRYAGKVPLVLKVNGKTTIPSDSCAFSPLTGSVEDAVRLGADAVGYTLYVGS